MLEKPRKIQQVYQCEIELVRVGEMCVICEKSEKRLALE